MNIELYPTLRVILLHPKLALNSSHAEPVIRTLDCYLGVHINVVNVARSIVSEYSSD